MRCNKARKKLEQYGWLQSQYELDIDLMEHLKHCSKCASLIQAELSLHNDITVLKNDKLSTELPVIELKERIDRQTTLKHRKSIRVNPLLSFTRKALFLHPKLSAGLSFGVTILCILSFIPFTFTEKVGYEIAIDGVDKQVAMDNQEINCLLNALGMEENKATTLLDSLEIGEIRLTVGDCMETCQLKISDVKTEKDVRLLRRAILELGCCQIDNINPIFKDESMSLLKHAVKLITS